MSIAFLRDLYAILLTVIITDYEINVFPIHFKMYIKFKAAHGNITVDGL